jgi:hypothetical protein
MFEFLCGGLEMKTGRILVLLVLIIGFLAGPWQAPAQAEMLGRVSQFKNLYYHAGEGTWYETKPDGSSAVFTLATGQSLIMTSISLRFYVSDPSTQTGPYRFYLLGPNSSRMYINNLNDIKYPGSDTVWGGGLHSSDSDLQPGVAFSVLPTPQVQQLPSPPANPNSGPIRTGTYYMQLRGYTIP